MKVLGIETSCDETGVAVIEGDGRGPLKIFANAVYSQIALHQQYGGVYPEVASREHVTKIGLVLESAIAGAMGQSSNSEFRIQNSELRDFIRNEIDAIAVAAGPGLIGSLLVGVNAAKTLAYALNKPLIGVNHHEGHIAAAFLESSGEMMNSDFRIPKLPVAARLAAEVRSKNTEVRINNLNNKINSSFRIRHSELPKLPALALVVSGGHTMLVLMRGIGDYEILGRTRDDAAGEAFDKTARLMGLPYPGGPEISRLAERYKNPKSEIRNPKQIQNQKSKIPHSFGFDASDLGFPLPRPMLDSGDLNFSFSGLKTAVGRWVELNQPLNEEKKILLAYEIQEAIVDVLVAKTVAAVDRYQPRSVIMSGGVAANGRLRAALELGIRNYELGTRPTFHVPPATLCTDNGAMIGAAGLLKALAGQVQNWYDIQANDKMSLANDDPSRLAPALPDGSRGRSAEAE
ncbi:MAG: tRNA (adenosine(37)-N6)-threonylcarbamoyltransferase complex transferase subunit TsaD [Patescibacteria group bacterium]